jgi:peptidoglycan/LPS O-acetylase OafA/YrhL
MTGSGYRPEIDGLRALAVVPVVMFHLGLGFPGGFVGVDVFFVISGFLITGIIRRGIEHESFSLAEFWERRIRRIFPALFVMVVATLAVGSWLLLPNELEELGMSSVAQAFLLANVYFWRDTNYFAGPAEFKPLLHTWSLAVEEQFYLFFPLVLSFFRQLSRKKLFALFTAVALTSFAGSVYGAFFHAGATFFLLPTRAWELLIGCMLAVFPWQCKSAPRRDSLIAMLGVLAIVLPIFLYNSNTPFPGLAAAPPVLGTAAIIFATSCTPSVWLCKALSLGPVVFIGLISYSLYLWHWPVIVYTRMYFGHFEWKQIVFASVVSIILAILSWRFVETPLRRTTFLERRRKLFGTALALSGMTIAFSVLLITTSGFAGRFKNYSPEIMADVTWTGERIITKKEKEKLDFIVFGDSHGMALSHTINVLALEFDLSGEGVFADGLVPLPNIVRDGKENKDMLSVIDRKRPRHVVLISRWSFYIHGYTELDGKTNSVRLFDGNTRVNSEPNGEIIRRKLTELGEFCSQRNVALWVIKEVPETGEQLPARQLLLYSVNRLEKPSDAKQSYADHKHRTASIESIFQSIPDDLVQFIDPSPLLFDDKGLTINYLNGRSVYRDNDHVTKWGAEQIRPRLREMFQEMSVEATPRKQ